nr:alpha/beta hydrolase-fold protein [Enterovibrio nigricans]
MDPVRENLKDRTGCLGALERFSFEAASLKGNLANEDCNRHLIVYLPKSYCESPERDYPIVYVLHGMDGTPESWFSLIPTDPSLDRIMDTLVQNGDVEEMILVAVDGSTSLLGSWYLNSPVSGNFFDLLTQETIRHRRKQIPRKKRVVARVFGSFDGWLWCAVCSHVSS